MPGPRDIDYQLFVKIKCGKVLLKTGKDSLNWEGGINGDGSDNRLIRYRGMVTSQL